MEIAVTDTGIGIGSDEQASLFKPFVRTPGARQRRIEGTGLGLALVKSMIEQHGGRVTLSSELGTGTTVTLHFPAASTVPSEAWLKTARSA